MRLLGATTITLRRVGSSDASVRASVQPLGKQDRGRERRKVYTKTELRVADPDAPLRADQLLIKGRTYDVMEVLDYSDAPGLRHYEATVEEEGTDAVTVSTPTGPPTTNDVTGAVSISSDDDAITGWLRQLRWAEVSSSGGKYQLGDVVFRTKRDNLSSSPTTDSSFTNAAGVRYRVIDVELDDRTQRWFLVGRKAP